MLLFYGGADVLHDVPLRRVYLQMLGRVWHGWQIAWAFEGIADVADYVGYPRDRVLSATEEQAGLFAFADRNGEIGPTSPRVSLRADGSFRFYPLGGDIESYLLVGPAIIPISIGTGRRA